MISSLILLRLKQAADEFLGEPCHASRNHGAAVLNEKNTKDTKLAGELAGPSGSSLAKNHAASLAYSLGRKEKISGLVYDLGRNVDVSIVGSIGRGHEVLATMGSGAWRFRL